MKSALPGTVDWQVAVGAGASAWHTGTKYKIKDFDDEEWRVRCRCGKDSSRRFSREQSFANVREKSFA